MGSAWLLETFSRCVSCTYISSCGTLGSKVAPTGCDALLLNEGQPQRETPDGLISLQAENNVPVSFFGSAVVMS